MKVLWRGTYSQDGDGRDRIAYKSGSLVEYVKLLDLATGSFLDYFTLAEGVNGEVKIDHTYQLTLEQTVRLVGAPGGRTAQKFSHRILGVEEIDADGKVMPAAKSSG
ncbi:MAG: hypothetical protein WA317_00580 [Mycobacterium sp.]|uniref:hypothetical protein n=1 Tax=Mycobacterium sp. TaxID=1785 RepID=UPI003CC5C020